MSSVNGESSSFSQQKDLANKKHNELTDQEKIYLLKREIDNLRGQLNDKEHDLYGWKSGMTAVTSSSSSSSSAASQQSIPYKSSDDSIGSTLCGSGTCFRFPLLTILLVATTLMWVVSKFRRRTASRSEGNDRTMWNPLKSSYFRPLRHVQSAWEGSQFELQEQVLATSSIVSPPSISVTSREEDAAIIAVSGGKAYEAPSELEVRFV
ncbi:hypothetical protein IV203_010071 [Nitzschia inconspicua]|uniref:Uncharacterized protein n=1 Tax=Nitzschia inconspicua TaxID=303405 RepID=A0A9K3PL22_9STRA|nr:hypothetical protein IV203_010071 [Nitzschia inconspicua]